MVAQILFGGLNLLRNFYEAYANGGAAAIPRTLSQPQPFFFCLLLGFEGLGEKDELVLLPLVHHPSALFRRHRNFIPRLEGRLHRA